MVRLRPLLLLAVVALVAACTSPAQPSALSDETQASALTQQAEQPAFGGAEPARSAAVSQQPGQEPVVVGAEGITVSGVGRISGRPDVLRVTIGVEAIRSTVQEALDAANTGASQIIDVLRDAGVAEEDIQTRDLSVYPRYSDRPTTTTPEITGYVVTNLVEAALRDLDSVGEVIGQALRAGGNDARLQQVTFALEDNEALLNDARARAFEDARRKAEQYAQMAGGSLGRLISVREVAGAPPQPIPFAAGGEAALDSAVPVEPGTQEVSVQVTATWQLG